MYKAATDRKTGCKTASRQKPELVSYAVLPASKYSNEQGYLPRRAYSVGSLKRFFQFLSMLPSGFTGWEHVFLHSSPGEKPGLDRRILLIGHKVPKHLCRFPARQFLYRLNRTCSVCRKNPVCAKL